MPSHKSSSAAETLVQPSPPERPRHVQIGRVILEPPGGVIPGGCVIWSHIDHVREAVATAIDEAISADRARRRWSWLPGYRRLSWGDPSSASADPGIVYRYGVPTRLAATELVTVFGFGYCRHESDGGEATAWGFFRFVPDRPAGIGASPAAGRPQLITHEQVEADLDAALRKPV